MEYGVEQKEFSIEMIFQHQTLNHKLLSFKLKHETV